MGQVYRGTDARLNRDVALKLLPEGLAGDADRTQRFKREAQVLASLNHPNIAAIYGLEESGSTRALVMELVEGPTLADRLAQGSIPIDDVIAIAVQLSEAIEYAHELGVVHRDLKPANIKVTPTGVVKVLDFGLAKALDREIAGDRTANATHSPTLSLAATQAGMILGTAAYMSPEQAKGKPADRRADIWSFGIVVFEMLAGRPVYSGETVSETMAHVITKEPDWSVLPAATPPRLRALLRRCLVKDPRTRLQAIGEARIALAGAHEPDVPGAGAGPTTMAAPPRRWREYAWAALAIAAIGGLAATLSPRWMNRSTPAEPDRIRFDVTTIGSTTVTFPQALGIISPDSRKIAFVAFSGARPLLWIHSLDTGTAEPLASTEGISPAAVMWSPDSRFLAYSAEGSLRRVAVTGGLSQVICALRSGATGTWGAKDVILFDEGGRLQRVSPAGGAPAPATALGQGETHRYPRFLPDGRHYFYLAFAADRSVPVAYVGDLESDVRRELPGIGSEVKYSPTGHVLFLRDGSLVAQAFVVDRLELAGEPFVVAERFADPQATAAGFSVSANGTLAFRSRRANDQQLTWFDRSGKPLGTVGPAGSRMDLELSADDRLVVFEGPRSEGQGGDIWALDADSGITSRVTSHPSREADPIWSPDGRTIVFRSDRDGGHLYQRGFRTVGEDTLLFRGSDRVSTFSDRAEPDSWSPDGRFVIYRASDDLWALPMTGDRQPLRITETTFQEREGRVSPDGRWIAYTSNEAGRAEIYVQSFPKPGLKQQVSAGSGTLARWSHDGRELYYASLDLTLMKVSIERTGDTLRFGAPEPLFALAVSRGDAGPYAVASDGRFLVNVATPELANPPITVILNWASGLGR
jgi:hypothetical protein